MTTPSVPSIPELAERLTREEIVAYQKREREFYATPVGNAFLKFKNAHSRAWQLDSQDNTSNRRLREVWDAATAAERTFREALGTALEELSRLKAGEGWQPIETAPKDGSHIMVGTFPAPAGQITTTTAHWFDSRDFGAKSGEAGWALSVNYDGQHSDHGVTAPTHWRPLPPAPGARP